MNFPTPIDGSTVLEPCYLKSAMKKQHFERLEELYHAASEQPPGQREAFLAAACGDDAELRRDVQALLEHSGEGVLDQPATQLLDPGGLEPGARLGPYEILSSIGSGGMGDVYRAQDTRLDRTVAIKVLASHFSSHPEARERFEREARAVSSLNHPHICTLHDVGSQDGIDYLVMEYLEGETLACRLGRGALPFHPALKLAIQIADALEAAHSKGLIHRDLKPANVMLSKSGVKLLDFGLAKKALEFLRGPGELAKAPLTNPGAIMGTVQYMAPEQLEGKEADARTDIFSFGVVLYEMLTGRRAFEGKSDASIIAAIMSSEPAPASSLQPLTPAALDRIIRTCLAKDSDVRWSSAHDVKLQLQAILDEGQPAAPAPRRRLRERLWMSAAAILLVVAGFAFFLRSQAGGPRQAIRFDVRPPDNAILAGLIAAGPMRLSPDGRFLAFVARIPGSPDMVWVRPLDSPKAHALPFTEGAAFVFWSWDSRFIAFFADGKLKKIEAVVSSGQAAVQVICDAPDGRGGSWGRSDVIVFWGFAGRDILQVPAAGGVPVPATKINDSSAVKHKYPFFLPDGRHFLFGGSEGVYAASLDSAQPILVSDAYSSVEYAPPGYLLYVRDRTLMARPFDAAHLTFTGAEFTVETHVGFVQVSGGNFSVSENGTLAYGTGDDVVTTQMVWFDRTGRRLNAVDQPGAFRQPQITADGSKLLVERLDLRARAADIWLYDLARNVNSRLTFGPGWQYIAVGSPDMSRIGYTGSITTPLPALLLTKSASGSGDPQVLLRPSNPIYLNDWSHDGKFALFVQLGDGKREDLWVLPLTGDRKPFPFLNTPFAEEQGQFSPDGKWIAYASDETGKAEVYVQSFPATGAKWRVSTKGGTQPRWRGDGKEIFYLAADRKLMAVQVKSGPHFEAGPPAALFQTGITSELGPYISFSYAVTGDGKRFLLLDPVGDESSPAMSIVLNWSAGLARNH